MNDDSGQNIYVPTLGGTGENVNVDASEGACPPSPYGPENVNVSGSAYPPSPSGPEQKTAILCQTVDVPTMVHSQYQQYDCTVVLHEPVHAFVPSGSTILTSEYVVAMGQLLLRYNKM
ncbi:uncharacterized protein LOC128551387 isoform X2 [Mercenaria mercenaria]|uniref:uncharacterized protein LOC128551387 isoform X2 n=1 Tax=Mercenaria mercenaria TaxID=6596 RepID=UPI00234F7C69|nr:uncharacterized protein LOC128551387 isoform X2 [Mercenaria mercenaria]